jgi:hypothetical protein
VQTLLEVSSSSIDLKQGGAVVSKPDAFLTAAFENFFSQEARGLGITFCMTCSTGLIPWGSLLRLALLEDVKRTVHVIRVSYEGGYLYNSPQEALENTRYSRAPGLT